MTNHPRTYGQKIKNTLLEKAYTIKKYFSDKLLTTQLEKKVYELGQHKIVYEPETTLIIKARHGFGDNIMATAVIEAIHFEYPDLRLIVLAKHPEIFENNPHIYRSFDLSKIPIKHPILKNAADMKYIDFFKRSAKNKKTHHIDGIYDYFPLSVSCRRYKPVLYLTEQEKQYRAEELAILQKPIVAVSPYGKKESTILSKIYPKSKWDTLVRLLIDAGANLIQVGLKSEGPLLAGCQDWRDIGYRRTASTLAKCDVVITHVGGIMHLATACDVPCVALFGGIEDPKISGYEWNRNISVKLKCAPCWRKKLCRKPECLDIMSPELIAQETLSLMKSRQQS